MGKGASMWTKSAAKRVGSLCSCFSIQISINNQTLTTISTSAAENGQNIAEETAGQWGLTAKSLCAICLDTLSCSATPSSASAVASDCQSTFTAECGHTFHLACIASNVRHGGVTCPICRAQWSHLPRHAATASNQIATDPVLQILEASIATSRVNRRSSLRSTRLYDDDDPVPTSTATFAPPRLQLALVPTASPHRPCLSVKLAQQSPMDIVLVVSPNGPHLRLLKQAVSLVVFILGSADRLAIVTYSAAAATRAFPLRRMSPHGKRSALRVVDRLFFLGPAADPVLGFRKGLKILEDRTHLNSRCCMLNLSDSPAGRSRELDMHAPVPVHRFHVGFGFGTSNGFVMHEFEELLVRLMGGVIREAKVRVGFEGDWVWLGEVRKGEERRILVDLKEGCEFVVVGYSYVEGSSDEQLVTAQTVAGFEEKDGAQSEGEREVGGDGGERGSCGERWDYFDPFMARRWAKHLHRA